jgi:hypothetical protein
MKKLGILLAVSAMLFACGSSKQIATTKYVTLVPDEPDYKKERRLEEFHKKQKTNSQGSCGPGTGGSYSAYSYRQVALKMKKDSIQ